MPQQGCYVIYVNHKMVNLISAHVWCVPVSHMLSSYHGSGKLFHGKLYPPRRLSVGSAAQWVATRRQLQYIAPSNKMPYIIFTPQRQQAFNSQPSTVCFAFSRAFAVPSVCFRSMSRSSNKILAFIREKNSREHSFPPWNKGKMRTLLYKSGECLLISQNHTTISSQSCHLPPYIHSITIPKLRHHCLICINTFLNCNWAHLYTLN